MTRRRRSTARDEQLLKSFRTWCVICRRRIPRKRHRRHAITCTDAHQKRLTRLRKLERDRKKCSHCSRPVTPEEMADFRQWRRAKVQNSAPGRQIAAKGIRSVAKGTVEMSDFALLCPEGRIREKRNRTGAS